jgi:hypothetical protein
LQDSLESWAHPGITAQILWKQDSDKSVKVEEPWAYIKIGERGFEGDLARFGHGLQRSYMLALLQELTKISDETAPTLIMGIEEPEIYQHPPQAKYLAETLNDLSEKDSQILICSHNPLFIPGDNFEAIRVVREKDNPSTSYISQLSYADLSGKLKSSGQKALKEEGMLAKLYPSLNPIINEMFFCNNLILTEGIEDVAYISTYLMLTERIMDFRKYGCHIVPVGGKSSIIKLTKKPDPSITSRPYLATSYKFSLNKSHGMALGYFYNISLYRRDLSRLIAFCGITLPRIAFP